MKIWQRIALIFTTIMMLAGCGSNQVTGNGKSVTKTRAVQDFNRIKISGAYKIEITQGKQESLAVTTDSNVAPLVMTTVNNDQLSIQNKTGISFSLTEPVLVRIVVTHLKNITASGANELIVSKMKGNNLTLNTNGSIQADLSGKVGKLNMRIAGSGKVDAANLYANKVRVRLVGSGQVMVNATNSLNTRITGSGSIFYSGNPSDVDQSIIGSGILERVK